MRKRIFVAADVDRSFFAAVAADDRFEVVHSPQSTAEDLAAAIGDSQVLVTRYHNRVTAAVFAAAPHLELIVQGTSGLDNIDFSAAEGAGVRIVGIPGENANAVAELVIGFIISLTRTVPMYDRMVRSGKWSRGDCADRRELRSHRLGIVGLGRVGSRVVRLAAAFDLAATAYDPYITDQDFDTRGAARASSLDELLRHSDIVSFHVPLTAETERMLRAETLSLLPEGAIVINTCRGPVVDLRAAFEGLRSGKLGGLAVDVYDEEPPRDLGLPDDPRLIVTPHIAGCSREAKESIGKLIYARICQFYGIEE